MFIYPYLFRLLGSLSIFRFQKFRIFLHRVNHSIWFGRGNFHTNTIEGLWSQIKILSHDFAGINFALLNNIEKLGINAQDYLNDWICSSLYFRRVMSKNFKNYTYFILFSFHFHSVFISFSIIFNSISNFSQICFQLIFKFEIYMFQLFSNLKIVEIYIFQI